MKLGLIWTEQPWKNKFSILKADPMGHHLKSRKPDDPYPVIPIERDGDGGEVLCWCSFQSC